ncbi:MULTISPECIES: ATP-binding protein [unclassified Streptomyces]|uniref:ATP-binding protein n=1 Tax=unclassified Streptomyces TaxID=2593676 RepID=UPI002E2E77F7|nr:ATP-binding protein [Streptomyces sp. NBC_00342]
MTAPSIRADPPCADPPQSPGADLARWSKRCAGPVVTELRLSAFAAHRGTVLPLAPLTLLAGPSGSGTSSVLRAYEALSRLAAGAPLDEVFPDPAGCVPEGAGADRQGRRGFRIGCTADGPAGPVRLELAVQAEPSLRIVGERLTLAGVTLLSTVLRDPGQSTLQAAWHTADELPVTRERLPDDRLGTALLPLRVAGRTPGQLQVLAAAEQLVVALRPASVCEPRPHRMRTPVPPGEGRLRRDCGNLAAVLHAAYDGQGRARGRGCGDGVGHGGSYGAGYGYAYGRRHARLVALADAGCARPVTGLHVERLADGRVRAVLARGDGPGTPLERLGDGELRYLALGVALLMGPGEDPADAGSEVPAALQTRTVLADGFDRDLDGRQSRELLTEAASAVAGGRVRLLGTVTEAGAARARGTAGATVVDLEP